MRRKPSYYLSVILRIILSFYTTFYSKIYFYFWGVKYGKKLLIHGIPMVENLNIITIGKNCRFISGYGNFVGGNQKLCLQTGQNGTIEIKDNTGISNSVIIAQNKITIGSFVYIGGGTRIYDNDFHDVNFEVRLNNPTQIPSNPINIEDFVFIGGHCLILKGVNIGHHSVVGAGSIVTKNIPPFEIWAGCPAKFIKKLDE